MKKKRIGVINDFLFFVFFVFFNYFYTFNYYGYTEYKYNYSKDNRNPWEFNNQNGD
ncbi:MAG: hypothetical protein FWD40_10035 [Treponema sp.]|nr:hypothetical protein [Treponema sp.]